MSLSFAQGNLEQLYKNRQYFDLRDAVEKGAKPLPPDYLFYRAAVANRFNDPKGSILFLDKFLKLGIGDDQRTQDAYEMLADNYVKTFQYAKAAATYKFLEQKYKTPISGESEAAYANLAGLWGALGGTAAQTVSVEKDTVIQGKRDKARLLNIPVELSGQKMDFVFDTGANLSTMTVSTAGKLGLKVIEADVTIGSSTANKVKSKLAVVREMRIGSVVARNVVFLVLEDEALYFPQADYRINAIVGFPVIQGFGRLTLSRDDRVTVAAKGGAYSNRTCCSKGCCRSSRRNITGNEWRFHSTPAPPGRRSTTCFMRRRAKPSGRRRSRKRSSREAPAV